MASMLPVRFGEKAALDPPQAGKLLKVVVVSRFRLWHSVAVRCWSWLESLLDALKVPESRLSIW